MTNSSLSKADLECLQMGRSIKLAGMKIAVSILREQMEVIEKQLGAEVISIPNGAIRPSMRRTLALAGIEAPQEDGPRRGRPPGKPPKGSKAMKGYWAKMTAEERSAEMRRRQALSRKPGVRLVQPNHPRNADHPGHAAWLAKVRRTARKAWDAQTPAQKRARQDAMLKGRGVK